MPSMNLDALKLHECVSFAEAIETFNKGDIIVYAKCGMITDLISLSTGKPKASEMPGMIFTGTSKIVQFISERFMDVENPLTFVYIQHPNGTVDCYISEHHGLISSIDDSNKYVDSVCANLMSGRCEPISQPKIKSSVKKSSVTPEPEHVPVRVSEKEALCLPATVGNVNGIPTFTYKI